jgi:hypothetical protein
MLPARRIFALRKWASLTGIPRAKGACHDSSRFYKHAHDACAHDAGRVKFSLPYPPLTRPCKNACNPSTSETVRRLPESHAGAVGGSFKTSSSPAYGGRRLACVPEYHPRQWVDRSSPAYRGTPFACVPEYHPRQWVDRSSPAYTEGGVSPASPNTTHGSGWIVQVQPTGRAGSRPFVLSSLSSAARPKEQTKNENPDTLLL